MLKCLDCGREADFIAGSFLSKPSFGLGVYRLKCYGCYPTPEAVYSENVVIARRGTQKFDEFLAKMVAKQLMMPTNQSKNTDTGQEI